MKPTKTKAQIRAEMQRKMDRFLSKGGNVDQISMGTSARDASTQPPIPPGFDGVKTERTPLPGVVAAIDSRRGPQAKSSTVREKKKTRKKKMVMDDFGEPLRWEWVEE